MTKIFAAAIAAMIVTAPAANAASMVEAMLKLQAANTTYKNMSPWKQAMIRAAVRRRVAMLKHGHH